MRKEIRSSINDKYLLDKRRQYIVKRSVELFNKKGYHSTTTHEIAEACGMSQGALYRYIGSKEDILYLVMTSIAQLHKKLLEKILDDIKSMKPDEAIIMLFKEYVEMVEANKEMMVFGDIAVTLVDDDMRAELFKQPKNVLNLAKSLLADCIGDGCSKDYIDVLAHMILLLSRTWGSKRWFMGDYFTFDEYDKQVTLFIRCIVNQNTMGGNRI